MLSGRETKPYSLWNALAISEQQCKWRLQHWSSIQTSIKVTESYNSLTRLILSDNSHEHSLTSNWFVFVRLTGTLYSQQTRLSFDLTVLLRTDYCLLGIVLYHYILLNILPSSFHSWILGYTQRMQWIKFNGVAKLTQSKWLMISWQNLALLILDTSLKV
jgi:hypothetical protein